ATRAEPVVARPPPRRPRARLRRRRGGALRGRAAPPRRRRLRPHRPPPLRRAREAAVIAEAWIACLAAPPLAVIAASFTRLALERLRTVAVGAAVALLVAVALGVTLLDPFALVVAGAP